PLSSPRFPYTTLFRSLVLELGMAFPMGDSDRQARTGHALQEDRGRLLHLNHRHTRLELLRAVAHEVRPGLAARDQLVQIAHHLADRKITRLNSSHVKI